MEYLGIVEGFLYAPVFMCKGVQSLGLKIDM